METLRPRGRDEVVEAVLASARRLIAERGPGVALRDIAEDAGVNFGLIYQYVGTKEQLISEVYSRAAQGAAERLGQVEHSGDALSVLMTLGDGTTARLLAWSVLGDADAPGSFARSPALQVLAGLVVADSHAAGAEATDQQAQVFAALAMVIALGWRLFGPTALGAAGLDGQHPERYDGDVRDILEQLASAVTGTAGTRTSGPGDASGADAPRG